MVIVDKNVNVLPRLAALVANLHMHLRMAAGQLRQQTANVVRANANLPPSRRRTTAAERSQFLRNRDPNLGNCGFH
jgi:hypothetical protein